jgi:hypothetical protein
MPDRPAHHHQRPGARAAIDRLGAVRSTVGGTARLIQLVGDADAFRALVVSPSTLESYFGKQQSLPREEGLHRINRFLEFVEPALADGHPISAVALRTYLRAGIEQRSMRNQSQTRGR